MMGQFERLCQQMLLLKKHIEIDKKLFSKGEQSELDAAYKKCSSLQNTYNQLTEELKASESSSQESKIQRRIENEVLKGVRKKVEGWLLQEIESVFTHVCHHRYPGAVLTLDTEYYR